MSTQEENLKLWISVEKTDPNHTKKAKIGGKSITAISPQYQILNATREFGPYGIAWGFKKIELDYNLIEKYNVVVFKGTFFCPDGESQIISSHKMFMDNAQKMVDADFAKKIETDALTKALSKMGFNADIFMGRYDDNKYLTAITEEFAPKPEIVPIEKIIEMIGNLKTKEVKPGLMAWVTYHKLTDELNAKLDTFKND